MAGQKSGNQAEAVAVFTTERDNRADRMSLTVNPSEYAVLTFLRIHDIYYQQLARLTNVLPLSIIMLFLVGSEQVYYVLLSPGVGIASEIFLTVFGTSNFARCYKRYAGLLGYDIG